nr:RagB/SusD family nutrient uptake outer membrane protein [Bacteroides sp. 51]
MTMKKIILFSALLVLATSCDDLWDPAKENYREKEEMYEEANYALGILMNGYTRIPTGSWSFNDVATDDAVSNDATNGYRKLATGEWTSNNNAVDKWTTCYAAIQYMNIMLEESDKVKWDSNESLREMFNDRAKGEAYALRGLFMYYLLQAHAGPTATGTMMGVPIYTESQTPESNHNVMRVTFDQCLEQMYGDFDRAEELLPLDFTDISSEAEIPARYEGVTVGDYNRVFGAYSRQRIARRIIEGLRTRATLLEASPAFNTQSNVDKWVIAADAAATVLNRIGGVSGLASAGNSWYNNRAEIDGLAEGNNPGEILWRTGVGNSRNLEEDNYPPTLYGKGRVNPTQNLVDAFPMKNGYPISDSRGSYESANPMSNRDPRLTLYIVANGDRMGPSNSVINTLGSSSNDGVNQTETSTRTGYYMRKLLRTDVNLSPLYLNEQKHYVPHIRYTEIFLNYAEAANEAWGPTGSGTHGYSAYDIIKAIRTRAGVGTTNGDPYLEDCKQSQSQMRELIRNERRLELCFEGFRFWDLRRWKVSLEDLTETARGTNLVNGVQIYSNIENRIYKDYMYYGPIPYSEILKWDNLKQNTGW